MEGFRAFDFENDPRWRLYASRLEIPAGNESMLDRFKAKWYAEEVDTTFDPSSIAQPSAGRPGNGDPQRSANASTSGSVPAQGVPQQAQAAATKASAAASVGADAAKQAASKAKGWLGRQGLGDSQTILFVLHCSLIGLGLLFAQPFLGGLKMSAWRWLLQVSLLTHGYKVYLQGGAPPLRPFSLVLLKDWLVRVGTTTNFQYAFLSIMLLPLRPMFVAVIPVLILAVYHASAYCARNFGHTHLWRKYGVKAHAWLTSHQRQALQVNAISEVGTGIFLVVLLVTPQRNFMTLFLYFNFLRMRYFSPDAAAYHREAWGMLDEKIQPVVQRMPILQKVLGFAQRWFLSLDPQRQAR